VPRYTTTTVLVTRTRRHRGHTEQPQLEEARRLVAGEDGLRTSEALEQVRSREEGLLLLYPISRYSKGQTKDRGNLFDNPDTDGLTVIGLAVALPWVRQPGHPPLHRWLGRRRHRLTAMLEPLTAASLIVGRWDVVRLPWRGLGRGGYGCCGPGRRICGARAGDRSSTWDNWMARPSSGQ
jgi:hypothetical protein